MKHIGSSTFGRILILQTPIRNSLCISLPSIKIPPFKSTLIYWQFHRLRPLIIGQHKLYRSILLTRRWTTLSRISLTLSAGRKLLIKKKALFSSKLIRRRKTLVLLMYMRHLKKKKMAQLIQSISLRGPSILMMDRP